MQTNMEFHVLIVHATLSVNLQYIAVLGNFYPIEASYTVSIVKKSLRAIGIKSKLNHFHKKLRELTLLPSGIH